jgi:hypothetical protein
VKQLFQVKNQQAEQGEESLSIRIGDQHVAYAVSSNAGKELNELVYCTAEEVDENELTLLLSAYPALKRSYKDIQIVYDSPEFALVPEVDFQKEQAAEILGSYPEARVSKLLDESIQACSLKNIYAVRPDVQSWLEKQFPQAVHRHLFTLLISCSVAEPGTTRLLVDFRETDFALLALQDGKVLIAANFEYSSAADVIYYLRSVCGNFSLSPDTVELSLSGLVDQGSALFRDLHQYFAGVRFRDSEWSVTGSDYPRHFFTVLNEMTRCA